LDENLEAADGDELYTPDSSRFVASDEYELAMKEGRDPKSLDKEPVRRVVRAEKKRLAAEGKDIAQQSLELGEEDVKNTIKAYQDIYFRLVGEDYNKSAAKQLEVIRNAHGIGR